MQDLRKSCHGSLCTDLRPARQQAYIAAVTMYSPCCQVLSTCSTTATCIVHPCWDMDHYWCGVTNQSVCSYIEFMCSPCCKASEHVPAQYCAKLMLPLGHHCCSSCAVPSHCLWVLAVFRAMARKALALGLLYTRAQEQPVTHDQLQPAPQLWPYRVMRNPLSNPPRKRSAAAFAPMWNYLSCLRCTFSVTVQLNMSWRAIYCCWQPRLQLLLLIQFVLSIMLHGAMRYPC